MLTYFMNYRVQWIFLYPIKSSFDATA